MNMLTAAKRTVGVIVLAGLLVTLAPPVFAQSLTTSRARQGRFEYTVGLKINNATSTPICDLEVQITSPLDEITSKLTPTGWSGAGPQNNAVIWEASNAGTCVPGGASKTGFSFTIDGVLPIDLHVCFADVNGKLIGQCQAIRVR